MNAHNRIHPLGEQFGDGTVGTETTVSERDIALVEAIVLLAEEAAFVDMLVALSQIQKRTTGEAEATNEFGHGEPTTLGLIGVLRPYGLVLRGVWHGHAGAIDDFDMAAQPQLFGVDPTLQFCGGVGLDVV
jgi:hypothetical protein